MFTVGRVLLFTVGLAAYGVAISQPYPGGGSWLGLFLLGLLAGLMLAASVHSLAWLAGGGRLSWVLIGLGNPVKVWLTRQGTFVLLAPLPVAITGSGLAARRPFARLPHITTLLGAALLVGGGLAVGVRTASALVDGVALGAAVLGGLTLLPPAGGGRWRALAPSFTGETSRLLDDAARASVLQDAHRVLALTGTVPADTTADEIDGLRAMQATALVRLERYGEAVQLLREELLTAEPGVPTVRRRLALASALTAAWEAGDDSGLPARTELPGLLAGPFRGVLPSGVRSVRAGALLVAGDAEGAYAMAAKVVPRLPRGLRGGPLCTMARAALELGRADEAARLLDRARAADPDEPRLAYVVPV